VPSTELQRLRTHPSGQLEECDDRAGESNTT
jgi:hypothetical protein